jgi:hypothetical protein
VCGDISYHRRGFILSLRSVLFFFPVGWDVDVGVGYIWTAHAADLVCFASGTCGLIMGR